MFWFLISFSFFSFLAGNDDEDDDDDDYDDVRHCDSVGRVVYADFRRFFSLFNDAHLSLLESAMMMRRWFVFAFLFASRASENFVTAANCWRH